MDLNQQNTSRVVEASTKSTTSLKANSTSKPSVNKSTQSVKKEEGILRIQKPVNKSTSENSNKSEKNIIEMSTNVKDKSEASKASLLSLTTECDSGDVKDR